jgi:hypothetical protein
MGTWLIFQGLPGVTNAVSCPRLSDCAGGEDVPGNNAGDKTVPETDTGGLVEYTEALERTVLKELGKMPP